MSKTIVTGAGKPAPVYRGIVTYQILVVHPHIDNVEYLKKNPKKNVVWGKKEDTEDGKLKEGARPIDNIVRFYTGSVKSYLDGEPLSNLKDCIEALNNDLNTIATTIINITKEVKKANKNGINMPDLGNYSNTLILNMYIYLININ